MLHVLHRREYDITKFLSTIYIQLKIVKGDIFMLISGQVKCPK